MKNSSYAQMVAGYAKAFREGKNIPNGAYACPIRPTLPQHAPKALIFSPHPDDECIIGEMNVKNYRRRLFLLNAHVRRMTETERQEFVEEILENESEYASEVRMTISYSLLYVKAMMKARKNIQEEFPGNERFIGWHHQF